MSTDKDDLPIEDDFATAEDEAEPQVETAKTNLSKRRTIDNLLEERRLQRQLADFDYVLPVGVKTVQGSFRRGEMVVCVGPDGLEVARGLANYSALEAQKIIGQPSDAIESVLGYSAEPELVHRDNLVLV